jgi:starch synthase
VSRGQNITLVHPTGNANVRQALLAFNQAGILKGFQTTLAWPEKTQWDDILPTKLRVELSRRIYPGIPPALIHQHPTHEILRLLGQHLPTVFRNYLPSIDNVYQHLDKVVAASLMKTEDKRVIYAYEDGAESVFRSTKVAGGTCVYDLPIGYWRFYHRLMQEEKELQPDWRTTLGGVGDSVAKLERKDAELSLADCIVVASSFTARTLAEYPYALEAPVYRIGYGSPIPGPPRLFSPLERPLRILYVGSIGQRKGISYLIEAVGRLQVAFSLTLLGKPVSRPEIMDRALAKHHWIPSAPHARVLQIMRDHDVLVLPSLFEGYGLVIAEAMAQGTVVIATPHTAAPDLIEDGKQGFIVPIRSAEAIAECLTRLAENRSMLLEISQASQAKAALTTWEIYRDKLVHMLFQLHS